jgi:Family of unknown function (DUF5330)
MRFLFRIVFWLTIVVLLLPNGGSSTKSSSHVNANDAMSAAKATFADARSFCERQPEACTIGSQTALAIGHRAQAGAKMIYDYLSEHLGTEEEPASPRKPSTQASGRLSRDTLAPADLAPPWRGPRLRKEAHLERQ